MSRFYAHFKSVIHRDGAFLQDLEMSTVLATWKTRGSLLDFERLLVFSDCFFVLNVGFSCKLRPAADLL